MTVFFDAGGLAFEWNASKAKENLRTHHVSFEEAATAFADPLARVYDDSDHSVGEERFLLFGRSFARRELVVVHVERRDRLRIISARLATRREQAKLREGY